MNDKAVDGEDSAVADVITGATDTSAVADVKDASADDCSGVVDAEPETAPEDSINRDQESDVGSAQLGQQPVAAEVASQQLGLLLSNTGEIQWPEFKGPSSRIIQAPSDWCDRGILVPHEAFRWLHNAIRCILAKFDPMEPGQDWKTAVFLNWLERYYVFAIHHHHHSEEDIYNPAIVEKGGELPEKITLDHKDIIEGLEKIASFRTRLEACDSTALVEFKSHLTQLIDSIEDHLAEEEEAYPAALRSSSMTEEDERLIVDKIIQSMGLDGNKIMLPSIIYAMHMWAGQEAVDALLAGLPPPILFAYNHFWLNDFRKNNLAVIQALQGSEPWLPETPVCGACALM